MGLFSSPACTLVSAVLVLLGCTYVTGLQSCCGDLGCFDSGAPFYNLLNRPVISVPKCSLLDTFKLHLNTRLNPISTQVLDPYRPPSIPESNFNVSKDTKIMIHGFSDLWNWPWWTDMVAAVLEDDDVNVIRLDWDKATVLPFVQSVADTRLAGAFVAKFVNLLKTQFGYDPRRIHIISHSLGVHAAAYTGERVDKIGRITGLDPGRLYFENTDPAVRLDPTDALVVDNIITDGENFPGFALGSLQQMGHINIYVNGGSRQPGCAFGQIATIFGTQTAYNSTNYDMAALRRMTEYQNKACSHWRAFYLFLESIGKHKCSSLAFECDSYEKFLTGNCFYNTTARTPVGYYVDKSLVKGPEMRNFHAAATERIPFCSTGYKLSFRLQSKTINSKSQPKRGTITLKLLGSFDTTDEISVTSQAVDLNPGTEVTLYFHMPSKKLGALQSMVLNWNALNSVFWPMDWMTTHSIYVDGNLVLIDQNGLQTQFLPARQQVEEKKDLFATALRG